MPTVILPEPKVSFTMPAKPKIGPKISFEGHPSIIPNIIPILPEPMVTFEVAKPTHNSLGAPRFNADIQHKQLTVDLTQVRALWGRVCGTWVLGAKGLGFSRRGTWGLGEGLLVGSSTPKQPGSIKLASVVTTSLQCMTSPYHHILLTLLLLLLLLLLSAAGPQAHRGPQPASHARPAAPGEET
jgi:hypothetical protein